MCLAGLIFMGHGVSLVWSHSRYLMGFIWLMFGFIVACFGSGTPPDDDELDPINHGFTGNACMVPLIILLGGLVGKIWNWIF